MAAELALFQQFHLRTPAATICQVVALFAVGLSKNRIEELTGVKGETVHRILARLVTSPQWRELRNIIVRKTGIAKAALHDLDYRYLELQATGDDLLHYQGYQSGRRARGDLAKLVRMARAILRRRITFGRGNT